MSTTDVGQIAGLVAIADEGGEILRVLGDPSPRIVPAALRPHSDLACDMNCRTGVVLIPKPPPSGVSGNRQADYIFQV